MHEFSIAADIMETVSEFASAHSGRKVLEVRLQIGELTCIEAGQLKFCYESIVKGTRLEDSTVQIEAVSASVKCQHCGYEGSPQRWDAALTVSVPTLQCPQCSHAARPIAGHECAIKSVRFVEREIKNAF